MNDREALRQTFESAADLYHSARPRYPDALFKTLADYEAAASSTCDPAIPPTVLEVGPASGIATEALAARGWTVTALELGADLAAAVAANLAQVPALTVVNASFDV